MSADLGDLDPDLYPWAVALVQVAADSGFNPVVTSTYRTIEEQIAAWTRWKTGFSPYPAAPPGRSSHEFRLAFDVSTTPDALAQLGEIWEAWGGTWGGRWGTPDPVHFEAPDATAWLRSLSRSDLAAVFQAVNGVDLNAQTVPF